MATEEIGVAHGQRMAQHVDPQLHRHRIPFTDGCQYLPGSRCSGRIPAADKHVHDHHRADVVEGIPASDLIHDMNVPAVFGRLQKGRNPGALSLEQPPNDIHPGQWFRPRHELPQGCDTLEPVVQKMHVEHGLPTVLMDERIGGENICMVRQMDDLMIPCLLVMKGQPMPGILHRLQLVPQQIP